MSSQRLTIFSTYVNRENLASYFVGSPDPSLNCPSVGQKIYISWRLCPDDFALQPLQLKLSLRFHNRTHATKEIPVNCLSGNYVYSLLNEEFFDREGLLTYKVELTGNGQLISEWRHRMWVDPIIFNIE
jgi:hypothetical protein